MSNAATGGAVLTLGLCLLGRTAAASDTTETFDQGAVDFELSAGSEGLGTDRGGSTIFTETLLGYGIVDRVSTYLRGAGAVNNQFADGTGEVGLGVWSTPVDSDHLDIDLLLDLGWSHDGPAITPGVEINLDAEPNLALWGAYLKAEESLANRSQSPLEAARCAPEDGADPSTEIVPVTQATVGLYWTVAEHHQLLLEADGSVLNNPAEDEAAVDFGGLAAGYNVVIHRSIELVNQICFDVPVRDGDPFSVGVSVGFITSILPTGPPPRDPTAPMASGSSRGWSSFGPPR